MSTEGLQSVVRYSYTFSDFLGFQLFHMFRTRRGLLVLLPLTLPLGYMSWTVLRSAAEREQSGLLTLAVLVTANLLILAVLLPIFLLLAVVICWLNYRGKRDQAGGQFDAAGLHGSAERWVRQHRSAA